MNCLLFLIYEVFYRKKFIIDNGGSRDPCAQTYSGVGAFSEPETQAVKHFLEDSGIDFISYLTVHSYGQMWLYPWGYTSSLPSDVADLVSSHFVVRIY
jgi:hypothetical protein